MAITPNKDKTESNWKPGLETMNEERIRKAFADLNAVLAEEGSLYGVSAVFARDTLIRTQVIHLPADEQSSVEAEKTYSSTKTGSYGYYN
jgi:hypothetical protein